MIYLNDKILAYLANNNISFEPSNYVTGADENNPERIIYWNKKVLGDIPSDEQLNNEYAIWLNNQKIQLIRNERNILLAETDWTQIADAPVDKQAWATYRQALRDITLQEGFPNDVIFPEKP